MAQQQQSQKPTFFLLFFFLLVAFHCISFLVLFFSCIFSFYLIVFSSYVNMVESISVVFPFSNRRLPLSDPSNNWNSTRGREEDKKRKRVGYTSINRRDDKREKTLGEDVVLLLIQFPRRNFSPLSFPSPHLIFFTSFVLSLRRKTLRLNYSVSFTTSFLCMGRWMDGNTVVEELGWFTTFFSIFEGKIPVDDMELPSRVTCFKYQGCSSLPILFFKEITSVRSAAYQLVK